MPLDPSISLELRPQVQTQTNPLGMVGQFAQIQNALNQNRLFQQTFQARQEAGQILAQAPDLETGLNSLYRNPVTAPFAGEVANSIRAGQQTLTQIQGEQQAQAQSGLAAWMKALPAAMADPSQLRALTQAQLSTLSPQARSRVQPAIDAITASLTEGLPSDPAQARAMFNQRLAGQMIAAGITPEAITGIVGKPTSQDVGGSVQFGTQLPPQLGGGFVSAGGLGKTLAPQVTTVPTATGGTESLVVGGGAGTGNPLLARGGAGANATPGVLGATPGAPASAGNVLGVSPGAQQQTYLDKSGANIASLQEDMSQRAADLPNTLKRINLITDALGNFQSGGGADMRATLAKGLQAVRNAGVTSVTPDLINAVGNQSLSDTQLFNAEIKPFVTSELREAAAGTGAGRIRAEVEAFLKSADATTDPATLMTLLNQARYALQVGYDQSQKFPQFKQMIARGDPGVKGLDLSDFYSWYNSNFGSQPLPGSTAGGLSLSPVPVTAAKGAAGPTGSRPPLDSFFK